jgi:hypothetical protein
MSVIEERNAEILRPELKLIAQGRSRELDVLPEVGNRDRVSIKTLSSVYCALLQGMPDTAVWSCPPSARYMCRRFHGVVISDGI